MASDDFEAADILYDRKLYALAISHWQQGVEKTTKALGLATGIADIDELKNKVLQRSLKVLLGGAAKIAKVVADRKTDDAAKLLEHTEKLSAQFSRFILPTDVKDTDIESWLQETEEVAKSLGEHFDALD